MKYLEKIVDMDEHEIHAIDPLLAIYQESGAFDKYVAMLRKKIATIDSDSAKFDAYIQIAVTSEQKLDDAAAAVDAYRAALEIRKDASVYAALESIFKSHKQYEELDALYAAQIEEACGGSDQAALLIKRADIARDEFHKDSQAIDLLNAALKADPANDAAFAALDDLYTKTKDFAALCDLLKAKKAVTASNDDIITINIRIAKIAAIHLGDQDKAVESLKDVLERQPKNIEAIDSLIEIYEKQKAYDDAFATIQKKLACLETKEEQADLYCHLAELLKAAGKTTEQIEATYGAALKLNPRNDKAMSALFDLAKKTNDTGKQLALLNVKADIQDTVEARNEILLSIADIAGADPAFAKEAAAALAKIYADKKDDIDLGEKLVNAYIKAGDSASAAPVLEGIIASLVESKQNKRLPPFYSLKGRMLKLSGDIAGARAAFEEANAIDKNNIPNNLELGILLYEAGEYDASLKIMQTLLLHQMNVKDKEVKTNIFYYLGMLRVKTNDPKRAKDMFNRALGVDPNHAPTKEAMAAL